MDLRNHGGLFVSRIERVVHRRDLHSLSWFIEGHNGVIESISDYCNEGDDRYLVTFSANHGYQLANAVDDYNTLITGLETFDEAH